MKWVLSAVTIINIAALALQIDPLLSVFTGTAIAFMSFEIGKDVGAARKAS
jgi:hypothetical protein